MLRSFELFHDLAMAFVLIRHFDTYPQRWAKIENNRIRWVDKEDQASAFNSVEQARLAYNEALASFLHGAGERLNRALAKGPQPAKQGQSAPNWPPELSDFAPDWALSPLDPPLEERSGREDLTAPMELWLVKGAEGWLGPGRFISRAFHAHFQSAQLFFSRAAALSAAKESGLPLEELSIARASFAFQAVEPILPPGSMDPEAAAIAAACEARDIEAHMAPAPKPSGGSKTRV